MTKILKNNILKQMVLYQLDQFEKITLILTSVQKQK